MVKRRNNLGNISSFDILYRNGLQDKMIDAKNMAFSSKLSQNV